MGVEKPAFSWAAPFFYNLKESRKLEHFSVERHPNKPSALIFQEGFNNHKHTHSHSKCLIVNSSTFGIKPEVNLH